MKLRHKRRALPAVAAVVRITAGRSWLERLPVELLGLIFRHVSGTAAVDAYADRINRAACWMELERMRNLICARRLTMAHVCRRWYRLFGPAFYHYAIYDGRADRLLVPAAYEQHVRWLLIHIPGGFGSFRSVVRALYWLPPKVRARILWFGLCMGNEAAISISEYGPLAAAFPGLRQIWLDIGCLATKLRSICPAIAATGSPPITALVLRDRMLRNRAVAVSLVHAAAASLLYLDLGHAAIDTACEVLWNPDRQAAGPKPPFPQLAGLFMAIDGLEGGAMPAPPPTCPFPKLKVLVCHAAAPPTRGTITTAEERLGPMQYLVAALLAHFPAQLWRLCIDDPGGNVPEMLSGKAQALDTVVLVRYCLFDGGGGSLQHVLDTVAAIPGLKAFTAVTVPAAAGLPLGLCCPDHASLRVLDIATWLLTLCDLQLLLSKLSRLEEARVTLAQPQTHPAHEDIGYNMAVQRLWINSAKGAHPEWDPDSLESLITLLARIPRLSEVLLFAEAVRWLARATAHRNRDDLLHLALHVNVGRCNADEKVVRRATSLFL